ncbi:uncharacterized protein LOC144452486 [Glandiceps talaboti]
MENELTCCICLELFDSPVILPCSHNFCRGCVRGLLEHGNMRCPTCRAQVNHRYRTVDDFQINRTLSNIISEFKRQQNKRLCKDHGKRESLFCLSCRVGVCRLCLHSREGKHFRHKGKQMKDLCETQKEKLKVGSDKLREVLTKVKDKFKPEEQAIELEEQLSNLTKEIDRTCDDLINLIKERQVAMKSMVKFQRDRLKWRLDMTKNNIQASEKALSQCEKIANQCNEHPVKFIKESSGIVENLRWKITALSSVDSKKKLMETPFLHSWKIKNCVNEMTLKDYPEPPIALSKFSPLRKTFGEAKSILTLASTEGFCRPNDSIFRTLPGVSIPRVQFQAKFGADVASSMDTRFQCIEAMQDYNNISLEELRVEDYRCGCRDVVCMSGTCPLGCDIRFQPTQGIDTIMLNGVPRSVSTSHQCITAMPDYKDFSLEELRLKDYHKGYGPGGRHSNVVSSLEQTLQTVSLGATNMT